MRSKFKVGQKVVPLSWTRDDEWVPKGRGMTVRILQIVTGKKLGQKIFYFVRGSAWPGEWQDPARRWIKSFEEKDLLTIAQAEVAALKNKIFGTKSGIRAIPGEIASQEENFKIPGYIPIPIICELSEETEASLEKLPKNGKETVERNIAILTEEMKRLKQLLREQKKQLAALLKKQSRKNK